MKLKDTLHMPNTPFNMKAGLSTREPVFQKELEEKEVYKLIKEKNKDKNHTGHICYSLDEFDFVMISLINDRNDRNNIKNCNLLKHCVIGDISVFYSLF